jgi:hypothetical protein
MSQSHLPPKWRERLAGLMLIPVKPSYLELMDAWQRAEGGNATWNPLNTTQPLPGAIDYNSVGVKNYPSPIAGIAATAITLHYEPYHHLWVDMQLGTHTARELVERNAHAFDTWGTGAAHVLALLA